MHDDSSLSTRAFLFFTLLESKARPLHVPLNIPQRLMLMQSFIRTKYAHGDASLAEQINAFQNNLTDLLRLTDQRGDPVTLCKKADNTFDDLFQNFRACGIIAQDVIPSFSFFTDGHDDMSDAFKNDILLMCRNAYREATTNKLPASFPNELDDGPV